MRAIGGDGRGWARVTAAAVSVAAACCLLASPAGAKVITDRVTGQKFGIVPVPPAISPNRAAPLLRGSSSPTCDSVHVDHYCTDPLTYHGGPVQHAENDYLFFWGPTSSFSSSYVAGMQAWLSGVAASDYTTANTLGTQVGSPLSVTQQYWDRSGPGQTKRFVAYDVKNAGTIKDTDAFPANGCKDKYPDVYQNPSNPPVITLARCLTSTQLLDELNRYLTKHHLPRGISNEYFILTPPGMGSCDNQSSTSCAIADYCGWHSAAGVPSIPSSQTIFADLPWLAGTPCDIDYALSYHFGSAYPGLSSSGIDSVVGVFSHELAESMTDPLENGWYGPGGGADEIGDKCAVQYSTGYLAYDFTGLPTVPTTGVAAYYNASLSGTNYLLQMEYDNAHGGCNQWDTYAQPTVTAISTPAHPISGEPAAFSLTGVSAPAGVAYVTWTFGDGTTGVSTSSTGAIQHSFPVGGSYTVSAVLTDAKGNEVKNTAGPLTVAQGPASIALKLSTAHPAPNGVFTVKLTGFAIPGGTLGSGGNRSEVDLYEQLGATCASTRKAEQSKVASGKATRAAQWFSPAGAFAQSGQGHAVSRQHTTVGLCGYVSRSTGVTDAHSGSAYTTT